LKSKEITLIIIFAVLGFVYTVFVAQIGYLITGIPGVNFVFIIGHVILISSQLLLYAGRRWRFFISSVLFVFLIIPTNFAGTSFDMLSRIPLVIHAFFADLFFNSIYGFFESHNKLFWWTILVSIEYNVLNPFFSILLYQFLYPPQFVASFINVVLLMLPVIIVESIFGGYMGYKIYERIKNGKYFPQT
jgi:hypothetical protein